MPTTLDLILNSNGNDGGNSSSTAIEQQQQSETPPVLSGGNGSGNENPIVNNGSGNNNGGSSESANPAVTEQKSEAPGGGYESLFRQLNPYKPPTQEELEKERKKQKRDMIFAAIGDGISALSNLFFTTQGAPNMYTGKNTMSERTKIRYDKLASDREKNNSAYFNGLMKARQADAEAADKERAWKRQLGIDKKNDERYEAEQQYKKGRDKLADERYDAEQAYKEGRDKVADEQWQQNYDEKKRQNNRAYSLSVQNGNGNGKKSMSLTVDGKTTYYHSQEDYERAVHREAQRLGIPTHQNVETEETDGYRKPTKKIVSTPKPISQLAAEVENGKPLGGDGQETKKKSPTSN
ncbi:MAG: hypothetical protein Q4D56_01960 [Bacteroides sp.]|nr:hypothetical protein [Bacteroides sp.]